jgi:gamma-glutamyltranspeptidase/glutathione hydrolase
VLQTIVNHLDFKMPLPEAVAEPRGSQRNAASGSTEAERGFVLKYGPGLTPRGHRFASPTGGEIGAATAIRLRLDGTTQAVAEPERRGGGSAMALRRR